MWCSSWLIALLYYKNFKPYRTPCQQEIVFIMVLARPKAFPPHCQTICETTLVKGYCIAMATSKVDAETPVSTRQQLSKSIAYMRGSPLQHYPISWGEHKEMVRFVPTNPRSHLSVQRNDWYSLGQSHGEMLRGHLYVNSSAHKATLACFEPPRLLCNHM